MAAQFPPPDSSSTESSARFVPYTTTKHRVTKGRYITSTDPRGYVPVYEYPLNNQWIMMDVDDGYVLWTGIWKALGNSKADIVKMIESQPDLASQLRRVRGGYLKIQGTWLPYEVALRLARRVAWPIREDLIPLFGPTFPNTCLKPDQPGYGQIVTSSGKRKPRRSAGQPLLAHSLGEQDAPSPPGDLQPPARPSSRTGPHSPVPISQGATYDYTSPTSTYDPSSYYHAPGPSSGPGVSAHTQHLQHPRSAEERYNFSAQSGQFVSSGSSRHRYMPYPPSGGQNEFSSDSSPLIRHAGEHRRPSDQSSSRASLSDRDLRYDLPPISTIGISRHPSASGYSLPPIGPLREGDRPDMDASSVLRRLRLEDGGYDGAENPYRPPSAPPAPHVHGQAQYRPHDHRAHPSAGPYYREDSAQGSPYSQSPHSGHAGRLSYPSHQQELQHDYRAQGRRHDAMEGQAPGWDASVQGPASPSDGGPTRGSGKREYYGESGGSSQSSRGPMRPW